MNSAVTRNYLRFAIVLIYIIPLYLSISSLQINIVVIDTDIFLAAGTEHSQDGPTFSNDPESPPAAGPTRRTTFSDCGSFGWGSYDESGGGVVASARRSVDEGRPVPGLPGRCMSE